MCAQAQEWQSRATGWWARGTPYLAQHHDNAAGTEKAAGILLIQAQSRLHGQPGSPPKILFHRGLRASNNLYTEETCVQGSALLLTFDRNRMGSKGAGIPGDNCTVGSALIISKVSKWPRKPDGTSPLPRSSYTRGVLLQLWPVFILKPGGTHACSC